MNGVADCEQTLVSNSTFVSDVVGWDPVAGSSTAEWVATGPNGSTGALRASQIQVQAGATNVVNGGPEQCVPATPGAHIVRGEVFIGNNDGDGSATINISFYSGTTCTNTSFIGAFQAPFVTSRSVWSLIQGVANAPAGTARMKIRLGINKLLGQPASSATFDHVLIKLMP
jgi:hypothetical protein